ncbi:hypothetical protein [Microbulbifer yueqingensis]|uniref:Uncharacterized protein n=1 Tax=Microbulbifer yueqingensis TaxID=658219 RepID=A0A1G9DHX4_9GAMM|nr:hypothetical protein [Microbulbifer yueqingensis]SDK63404.1 hypothetical protein SAMN05216212_2812 [Microbulbifer yueqingensis]
MSEQPYIESRGAQKDFLYPFFLFHMGVFGGIAFYQAYFSNEPSFSVIYVFGGFGIYCYLLFYKLIFGRDAVRWMFINAALGIWGIYNELGLLLGFTGRSLADYSVVHHLVPFTYYVLYTFLLRQAVIDLCGARNDEARRRRVEHAYIAISLLVYTALYFL